MSLYKLDRPDAVFDIECYVNYFLIAFRNVATGNIKKFEFHPTQPLDKKSVIKILRNYRLTSFNGINYDIPMVLHALCEGTTNQMLKKMSDAIIMGGQKPWHLRKNFAIPEVDFIDHIDLIEVAPGIASLKAYGGKMHSTLLQDLPIEHTAVITPDERKVLSEYCANDLNITVDLKRTFQSQLDLRRVMSIEYGVDLRSKSDAQIAEAVIKSSIERITNQKIYKPEFQTDYSFKFDPPSFIRFETEQLREIFNKIKDCTFFLDKKGSPATPDILKKVTIKIGKSKYKIGMGGLHSQEKCTAHLADNDTTLEDIDVASFYPIAISNQSLYPEHLGKDFLVVYRRIIKQRLEAKAAGNKVVADCFKIVLNGSFGKFGSPYSTLYSPSLLIQVTITGQLALLMLIERIEGAGIPIVSANTDGIVAKCPKRLKPTLDKIVKQWEDETNFDTESNFYSALYSRDVNNYIAVKTDGKVKLKGAYAPPIPIGSSWPNPANEICTDAVVNFLTGKGTFQETLEWTTDIRKFVTTRKVAGGAVKNGEYLGKAIRWYYAKGEKGIIEYQTNGNKVPRSEGAKPLMNLPEIFPRDVDYDWYIKECWSIMADIGADL